MEIARIVDEKRRKYEKLFDINIDYNLALVPMDKLIGFLKKILPPGIDILYTKEDYLRPAYQFTARSNILGGGRPSIMLCPELIEREATEQGKRLEECIEETIIEELAHIKIEELGWEEKIVKALKDFSTTYYPDVLTLVRFRRIGENLGEYFASEIIVKYLDDGDKRVLEDRMEIIDKNLSALDKMGDLSIIDLWCKHSFVTTLPPSYKIKNPNRWKKDEEKLINHNKVLDRFIKPNNIEKEFYDFRDNISSIPVPPKNLDRFFDKVYWTYLDVVDKLGEEY